MMRPTFNASWQWRLAYARARPYRRVSITRLAIDGIAPIELDLCARHRSNLINTLPGVRQ